LEEEKKLGGKEHSNDGDGRKFLDGGRTFLRSEVQTTMTIGLEAFTNSEYSSTRGRRLKLTGEGHPTLRQSF
jgi:hypothetical protein